jgi:hypothetical protein
MNEDDEHQHFLFSIKKVIKMKFVYLDLPHKHILTELDEKW